MAWKEEHRLTHWKLISGIFKLWIEVKEKSVNGFKKCAVLFRLIYVGKFFMVNKANIQWVGRETQWKRSICSRYGAWKEHKEIKGGQRKKTRPFRQTMCAKGGEKERKNWIWTNQLKHPS